MGLARDPVRDSLRDIERGVVRPAGSPAPTVLVHATFDGPGTINLVDYVANTDVIGDGFIDSADVYDVFGTGGFVFKTGGAGANPGGIIETGQTDVTVTATVSAYSVNAEQGAALRTDAVAGRPSWWAGMETSTLFALEEDFVIRDSVAVAAVSAPFEIGFASSDDDLTATLDGGDELTFNSSEKNDVTTHGFYTANGSNRFGELFVRTNP